MRVLWIAVLAAIVLLLLGIVLLQRRAPFPIDAVVTWVDSTSDQWKAERKRWEASGKVEEEAISAERFPDQVPADAELKQCLLGALRNMPWLRRIYVLTARPQRPACLDEGRLASALRSDRIRLVHHDQCIPGDRLPTFNSHMIEAHLDAIPGLAEHFLYLNDDTYSVAPIGWSKFFTLDGLPIIQSDSKERCRSEANLHLHDRAFANVQRVLGVECSAKPIHWAQATCRSLYADARERFPEWSATEHSRFRSSTDLIPVYTSLLYGLANKRSVLVHEGNRLRFLFSGDVPTRDQVLNNNVQALCINAPKLNLAEKREAFDKLFKFL